MGLKAHRFAGDPVLEACLAGTQRMAIGESSQASVRRVQQALIESGYGLPRFSPDGVYGDETANAVAQYKSDRAIVPQTMAERGLTVDHTTIYHWVQRYAPVVQALLPIGANDED